jgi:hypothetical protein
LNTNDPPILGSAALVFKVEIPVAPFPGTAPRRRLRQHEYSILAKGQDSRWTVPLSDDVSITHVWVEIRWTLQHHSEHSPCDKAQPGERAKQAKGSHAGRRRSAEANQKPTCDCAKDERESNEDVQVVHFIVAVCIVGLAPGQVRERELPRRP